MNVSFVRKFTHRRALPVFGLKNYYFSISPINSMETGAVPVDRKMSHTRWKSCDVEWRQLGRRPVRRAQYGAKRFSFCVCLHPETVSN
jgi:hypothetical protein